MQAVNTVTISIKGMTCMSCVNSIESIISKHTGVEEINVSLEMEEAIIKYKGSETNIGDLCSAIEDMGFVAVEKTISNDGFVSVLINVEGMTCHSCVKNIESVIGERTFVKNVIVSLEDKNALIEYNNNNESAAQLCEAICDMGFDAFLPSITETVTIAIEGMTCMSCVATITEMMLSQQGVISIIVSLEENNAIIDFDSFKTNVTDLCTTIEDMGFEASCKEKLHDIGKIFNLFHFKVITIALL